MKIKTGIRTKLLLVFIGIILFNTLAIYVLGTRYIESYYKYEKEIEIENVAKTIINMKKDSPSERRPWYTYVIAQEANYYDFLIFDYEDAKPTVMYYSKSNAESNSKSYQYWINQAISYNVFVTFNDNPDSILALENNEHLYVFAMLDENQYLFMSTPLQYVETTSQLAIRFFTYISGISMLIAFVLIIFVSSQIAKPIRKISSVATKISNMQFDEKCTVKGNDEVSELAKNINVMSTKIEENMNVLIEKNEVLKKDLDRQEETDRLRRQFISNVSHDFKTPLALIQAYSEVLSETSNDQETKETLDLVLAQARQMNVLVNELLSLNQLESGLIKLEKSFFPLDDVILEIVSSLDILLKDKNLTYEYTKDNEYIVEADYQRIRQVIQNLIENAIKYTPNSEKFSINVCRKYDLVELSISNIAPPDLTEESLEHLFDSFYMKNTARTATLKSYGLGLAIVKATMDLHEQSCGVRLENGMITFYITLDIYTLLDDEDDDWDDKQEEANN